jgi:hypothetical protein
MSKHTPAPWGATGGTIHGLNPTTGKPEQVIAELYVGDPTRFRGNLRLIKAAPSLLAACKAALEEYRSEARQSPTVELLRAAIARAEGAE